MQAYVAAAVIAHVVPATTLVAPLAQLVPDILVTPLAIVGTVHVFWAMLSMKCHSDRRHTAAQFLRRDEPYKSYVHQTRIGKPTGE